jgi:crotonobetainyl-CoA:carnitine CoA-transferase CaiB-like acyl-CoA transferase
VLAPYRVLDLTDVRGQIAGMILGDLGADVVRVEPPGGSPARLAGPRLLRGPEAMRSLSFGAYNRNKRSITLDLASPTDRECLLDLVAGADFVLDSGPPSWLDEVGLGFDVLRQRSPLLVHVRITPFGCDGPRAMAAASDLTIAALGGPVSLQGQPDRAPVRVSIPQVWRHAGAEAAVAALIGHARARTTGAAVFVDVSAQASMTWTMLNGAVAHAIQGRDYERAGSTLQIGTSKLPLVYPCRDGHVVALARGRSVLSILDWLLEEGVVDEAFATCEEWSTLDARLFRDEPCRVSQAALVELFTRFLADRNKQDLFDRGLDLGMTIAPVNTLDDLLAFDQLVEREAFEAVALPDGGEAHAPGAFARITGIAGTPLVTRRPAPRPGEHTAELKEEMARAPRRAARRATAQRRALPLEGLRVADFSWVGVGPISAKYLADHGADVIRIESQTRGDDLRSAGPFKDGKPGWNRSHFYGEFNTSKRSLCLDLKHERSAAVTERLLAWADVAIESFTPGSAERLGIGYERARAIHPAIVMASTCLMGQTGPRAAMAGYGYHAAAVAGFYELTGWPDRAPAGPWQAYTDTIAPRFLTATLLAALDERERTGAGCHIDLAQLETALHFLAPELLARQATGEAFPRRGNGAPDAAPHGVFPCAGEDQWCAIAVLDDVQWRALRAVLGEPRWALRPSLDRVEGRLAVRHEVEDRIATWTRERAPGEVMQLLLEAGVPAGVVQRSSDLLRDPQLRHRRFHRELEHGEMGRVPYSGHQFRVSGYDNGPRGPAPRIGEHSFEVLEETLGFDPDQIADLVASGAIS